MELDEDDFFAPSAASSEGCGEEFWSDSPVREQPRRRAGGRLGRPQPTPAHGLVGVWLVGEDASLASAPSAAGVALGQPVPRSRQVQGLALIHWGYESREPTSPMCNPALPVLAVLMFVGIVACGAC